MELIYKTAFSTVKPKDIEFGLSTVYFRKDMKFSEETGIWTYQEAEVSKEEYEAWYRTAPWSSEDNQLVIMNAIADLYDMISSNK